MKVAPPVVTIRNSISRSISFARPCSSVGEHGTPDRIEPTGTQSPVRAASHARYLILAGIACDQWQRSRYITGQRKSDVSEGGGPCPALGHVKPRLLYYVKRSTINSAVDPEFSDRVVEVRTCATSTA